MNEYKEKQKVWITTPDTFVGGGGRHRGVVDAVSVDMFDETPLYLVKTCGVVIPARKEALTECRTKSKKLKCLKQQ
jgi:hypothetical protein